MEIKDTFALVVVDLDRAKLKNGGESSVLRGGPLRYSYTRDTCLETVETFLEDYSIAMHYTDVEFIAAELCACRDAYVGGYLFSYVGT